MERTFRKNRLTQIGEGTETPVFSMQRIRDGKDRSIVLKTYENLRDYENPDIVADKNGFGEVIRKNLESKHTLLKQAFGPYIPGFRIIKNSDVAEDRYFAVQQKIDLPTDPDIFGFFPEDFQDDEFTTEDEARVNANTRMQLIDLADRLQEQFVRFESQHPGDAVVIDLEFGENNIVLDRQGNLHYLDMTVDTKDTVLGWNRSEYINCIKKLKLLGGVSQEDLDADPFFQAS